MAIHPADWMAACETRTEDSVSFDGFDVSITPQTTDAELIQLAAEIEAESAFRECADDRATFSVPVIKWLTEVRDGMLAK